MVKVWFVVVAAIILLMQINGISGKDYIVGDEDGWGVPSSPEFYSSWAAKQVFEVNDTLVFNFSRGSHTVATVSRDGYEECDAGNSEVINTDTPTEITVNQTGSYYFICTVGGHCDAGQKLAITVGGSSVAPMSADTGSSLPNTPISTFLYFTSIVAFVIAFL